MLTLISGTNRPGSNTEKIALHYHRLLQEINEPVAYLSLLNVNPIGDQAAFKKIEEEILFPATKYIFIMPEYNGSFPGILKLVIDQSDVKKAWWNKKALLTGVATGRAGNLRGMDQMTGILNHLKIVVHPNKLPISMVDKLLDENNHLNDGGTINAIKAQVEGFLRF